MPVAAISKINFGKCIKWLLPPLYLKMKNWNCIIKVKRSENTFTQKQYTKISCKKENLSWKLESYCWLETYIYDS